MYLDTTRESSSRFLPFTDPDPRCDRCAGVGLRIAPNGLVEKCPEITLGNRHAEPSAAALGIQRAVIMLSRRDIPVDAFHFEIARTLAKYSTTEPCTREILVAKHFGFVTGETAERRAVAKAVQFLRDIWFLPVGSRKYAPTGYWIVTDEADFKEWVDEAKSAPISQLSTIHRLARANFPVFAEQLELEFWSNVEGREEPVDEST